MQGLIFCRMLWLSTSSTYRRQYTKVLLLHPLFPVFPRFPFSNKNTTQVRLSCSRSVRGASFAFFAVLLTLEVEYRRGDKVTREQLGRKQGGQPNGTRRQQEGKGERGVKG